MKKERLERIKSKIHRVADKQIGNVRFDEETYNKIVELAQEFDVTKQFLIKTIVQDSFFEN